MSHDHAHGAGHDHGTGANRTRLTWALAVTLTIFVIQIVGAIVSGSLALLFDSVHVLTDSAGLMMALFAAWLAARPASGRRTWGFARAEVLSATAQAALLLGVGIFVFIEGIRRLIVPEPVAGKEMIVFAAVGLVGNVIAIFVLTAGRKDNFNMRAAFLEVVNDALGSVAVLIAALIITFTAWVQADAIVAMLIGVLILPRTVKLLMETISVLMEAAPKNVDLASIREHLLDVDHVVEVHDLHLSQIASDLPVLTAHVVVETTCFHDGHAPEILDELQACVAQHFPTKFKHSTFQLEPGGHQDHEAALHT